MDAGADLTGWHPVTPPPRWRWRRRLARVPWLAIVVASGTVWCTWWYASRPETGVVGTVSTAVAGLLLLGAAAGHRPWPRRRTVEREEPAG